MYLLLVRKSHIPDVGGGACNIQSLVVDLVLGSQGHSEGRGQANMVPGCSGEVFLYLPWSAVGRYGARAAPGAPGNHNIRVTGGSSLSCVSAILVCLLLRYPSVAPLATPKTLFSPLPDRPPLLSTESSHGISPVTAPVSRAPSSPQSRRLGAISGLP